MTHIEDIFVEAVGKMNEYKLGQESQSPSFGFGDADDLKRLLHKYPDGKALPLVWLTPISPLQLTYGLFQEATLSVFLATRETNRQLSNVARLRKSYDIILSPMWEDLQRRLFFTNQIALLEESIGLVKIPDFTGSDEVPINDIWDVLNVQVTAQFAKKSECKIHKLN